MIRSHLEYLDSIKTHSKGVFFSIPSTTRGYSSNHPAPPFFAAPAVPKAGTTTRCFFRCPRAAPCHRMRRRRHEMCHSAKNQRWRGNHGEIFRKRWAKSMEKHHQWRIMEACSWENHHKRGASIATFHWRSVSKGTRGAADLGVAKIGSHMHPTTQKVGGRVALNLHQLASRFGFCDAVNFINLAVYCVN